MSGEYRAGLPVHGRAAYGPGRRRARHDAFAGDQRGRLACGHCQAAAFAHRGRGSAPGTQNIGAGKPERAKKTLFCAIALACGFGAFVVALVQVIAEPVVGRFTPDAAVTLAGGQYRYIWDSFFACVQFSLSGYFCACGRSGLSFLHNFLSIVLARFRGSHLQSPEQYARLLAYTEAHGLTPAGFSREITLVDYGLTSDPEKFVTEITIPVRPAG